MPLKHKKTVYSGLLLGAMACLSHGESNFQGLETFHADYLQQEIDAMHASGQTNATLLHQSSASFDINPVTGKTEGLMVGNGQASLSYETAGNLPATNGSIEVRFKPIDWNPSTNTYHMLFQTATAGSTPPAKLYIYKASQNGLGVYFSVNSSNSVFMARSITNWNNHIYHHLVLTYEQEGDAVLFVDGTEVGRKTIGTPSNPATIVWPANFTVGPWSSGFGNTDGQTDIERVRIYNAALSASAVRYLADKEEFNQLIGDFSDWFTHGRPKLGLAALDKNTVLPPWTPVSMNGSTGSCWNREYSFSGSNLLENATSGTNSLLDGPIALQVAADGQDGTILFGAPTTTTQGDGRVVFERNGGFGNIDATLTYVFEYDGLLDCNLELTRQNGASLDALSLEIPFKEDVAQLMHYVGAPSTYTSQNLPRNSYGKAIPPDSGTCLQSGLKTMVWIGNNRHGLLWSTESDQYWWPKDRDDCIVIERKTGGDVDLSIEMVASSLPTNAPQTLNYRFGLMATPIKPMPTGWRAWTHTDQAIGRVGDRRGINVIYWPTDYRFMLLDQDPTRYRNIQATRDLISGDHTNSERRFIIPYWTRTTIYDERDETDPDNATNTVKKVQPEAPLMTREWGVEPNRVAAPYRLSASTEWADYLVWSQERFASVMGHTDGIYLDEVQPIPNTRAESNSGYDALDGTRRPTFELSDTRNLCKRLVYNTWQRNTERPRAIAHCSATQTAPAIGSFDLWLIGEQYNSGYLFAHPELKPPENDPNEEVYYYSYALPMDRVRAECYHGQWGEVIVWLPQLKNQPNIMTNSLSARDMLSRVMQADVVIWPLWCNTDEIYNTWAFRKDFGIGDTDVTFHPYWEQTDITTTAPETAIGYYSKASGERLVLVSNLKRQAQTVEVDFGSLPVESVTDAETGSPLSLNSAGKLELDMPRNNYRALRVDSTATTATAVFIE